MFSKIFVQFIKKTFFSQYPRNIEKQKHKLVAFYLIQFNCDSHKKSVKFLVSLAHPGSFLMENQPPLVKMMKTVMH